MKRIIASCFIVLFALSMNAQIKLSAAFDGYWSKWESYSYLDFRGNYGGFIIYDERDGPWSPLFKFTIDNFRIGNSKTQKLFRKNKVWYKYQGTVEYFICDDYMTAYDLFKSHSGVRFVSPRQYKKAGRPVKKVISKAIIKIAPYKKHPKCYNILYDKVGLAIDLNNMYFEQ